MKHLRKFNEQKQESIDLRSAFNRKWKLRGLGKGRNLRNPYGDPTERSRGTQNEYIISMDAFKEYEDNFDGNKFSDEIIDDTYGFFSNLKDYGYIIDINRGGYPLVDKDKKVYAFCLTIDANSFDNPRGKFIDWDMLKNILVDFNNFCNKNNLEIHVGTTWGEDLMPNYNYITINDFIQKNKNIEDLRKIELIVF
jgi:hypothetical protein